MSAQKKRKVLFEELTTVDVCTIKVGLSRVSGHFYRIMHKMTKPTEISTLQLQPILVINSADLCLFIFLAKKINNFYFSQVMYK